MSLDEWQVKKLSERLNDGKCKRCGTIISYSEGVADCPRCHGKDESELIKVHIAQAEENLQIQKLGYIFIGSMTLLIIGAYIIYTIYARP